MAQITVDTNKMQMITENIHAAEQDGKLIIVIDPKDLGPSTSGKMNAFANTGGHVFFPGGLKGMIWLGKKV